MIDGLGAGANGLTIGMRGAAPLFAGGIYFGSYADYAVIEAVLVTPLPDALPFEDAILLFIPPDRHHREAIGAHQCRSGRGWLDPGER